MNSASKQINDYLETLPQWQKNNLASFRKLLHEVEPTIEEAWKWSVPVFLLNGKMLFAMSGFKAHTKYNFISNGALLKDKAKLFNNGFESKKSRAVDLQENEKLDQSKLRALITSAVQMAKQ